MVQTANSSLFKMLTKEMRLLWVGLSASVGAQQQERLTSLWELFCSVTRVSLGHLYNNTARVVSRHDTISSKVNNSLQKIGQFGS